MHARWGKLYRDMTPQELKMEREVAKLGVPYRVQFPGFLYGFHYYLDFYLPTLRVCLEVDDPSHKQKAFKDAERDRELLLRGITTVRVTNEEVDNDAPGALRKALSGIREYDGSFHFPPPLPKDKPKPRKVTKVVNFSNRRK